MAEGIFMSRKIAVINGQSYIGANDGKYLDFV